MPFINTDIPGLIIFEPRIFEDSRGYFFESYNSQLFHDAGIDINFVQDNQSSSSYGVIRGLHFQKPPYSQTKLIRVVSGTIIDVAVDLRKGSPAYGRSFSIELSAQNKRQLFIPKGFAHGFSVVSDRAEVAYKCDEFYNKENDGGIHYADPALKIDWQVETGKAIVSDKDASLPVLSQLDSPFTYVP